MQKNLIYYTVYNNKQYIKQLNRSIDTLIKTGYTGDILIITNLVLTGITKIKNNVFIFKDNTDVETEKIFLNGRNKIWKYKNIDKYDKIIYCDCDVFWLKSPNNIFELINDKEISFSYEPNATLCESFFVGEIQSFAQPNLPEMNTGTFGFDSKIVNFFKDIDDFFEKNKDYWDSDQGLLNAYVYAKKIYNTNLNEQIGFLNAFENTLNADKNTLIHFFGEDHESVLTYFDNMYKKFLT